MVLSIIDSIHLSGDMIISGWENGSPFSYTADYYLFTFHRFLLWIYRNI